MNILNSIDEYTTILYKNLEIYTNINKIPRKDYVRDLFLDYEEMNDSKYKPLKVNYIHKYLTIDFY